MVAGEQFQVAEQRASPTPHRHVHGAFADKTGRVKVSC
jgi:hypothetical protein